MKTRVNNFVIFLLGFILGGALLYFSTNYIIQKKENPVQSESKYEKNSWKKNKNILEHKSQNISYSKNSEKIDQLTSEELVISFVKKHRKLPDYYITKSQAKNMGWVPSNGNLCEVAPGKAIGGDRFSNREKKLPVENLYMEADINYRCGHRNAHRIVYTQDGKIWITYDHYKSFEKRF